MKKIIFLIVVVLFLSSCNDLLKKTDQESKDKYVSIEYVEDRKYTSKEIAKFLNNGIGNISISNGYSYENGDDSTGFISVQVKNPDGSIGNEAIAVDLSKEILKILQNEISNLKEFDKVHVQYYTIGDYDNATIRKETQVTLKVNL